MSTATETDELVDQQWHQNDDDDLVELCEEYWRMQGEKKIHEQRAKEIEKDLKNLAQRLQGRMDGHKAVKTLFGWSLKWTYKTRKGYTVAPTEYEQWELKCPYVNPDKE